MYSGRQVHEPTPFRSLQMAFAPHGDGLHGVRGCSVVVGTEDFDVKVCKLENFTSKKKIQHLENLKIEKLKA